MSTSGASSADLVLLPVRHVLATVALVLFCAPAAELANRLLGSPLAGTTLSLWLAVASLLVAPLFVADVLSLSRLWDYLLLSVLGSLGFAVVGLVLTAVLGLDGPSHPLVLEVEFGVVGYGTAFVVGYLGGVEL